MSNHEGVEKEYPYKWYLQEYTEKRLKESFKGGNYEFVNLRDYNITKEDLAELFEYSRRQNNWIIPSLKQEVYNRLKNMGIKGVISIYNDQKVLSRICGF